MTDDADDAAARQSTTSGTLAKAAIACLVLGWIIGSPAGAMFLHTLAAVFALPAVLMARGHARFLPGVVLGVALAMAVVTYPEYREHMADYAARAAMTMTKGRLEAFSDGVLAIIITIMVLELKVPHGADLAALQPLLPVFLSYVLSFVYVAIYWNNHHHLLQAVKQVNGPILWANTNLLFWLSLFPFATAWMGENHFATLPVAMYGVVLLAAALAYTVLVRTLLKHHEKDSALARAIGSDFKGKVSLALYVAGIGLSFVAWWLGALVYAAVACIWLVPDARIEKSLAS